MDRWTVMSIRIFAPAAVVALAALLASILIARLGSHPLLALAAEKLEWIPFGALLLAAVLACAGMYRLWRWQQGFALICDCGGLLGRERLGVRGRGDYRKCLACGRNINHSHYTS